MNLKLGKDKVQADAESAAQTNAGAEAPVTEEAGGSSENVDLSKLRKKDLLEIMLRQGEEIDALRAEVAELQARLDSRDFELSKVGSIAEASLAVTEIFKEADKAAMIYLANLKRIAEEGMKK